jgi:diacylglycerol kinase family enzyme
MLTGAPRHPVLFVNLKSGGGKAQRAGLVERARERGIEAVALRPGDDLATLVEAAVAAGADALGVAGGDGSLAVVAAVAAARDLPFVCVPAGTRNHFARDVGAAPNDVVGALDAFGEASERTIDTGSVNECPFLNNVSLGVYGEAVRREVRGPSSAAACRVVDDRGHEH